MALVQRVFDQTLINTFAFKIESMPSPQDEQTFLSSLFNGVDGTYTTAFSVPIRNYQTSDVRHVKWQVQKVSPTPSQVYEFAIDEPGAAEGSLTTVNIATCITRMGSGAGRRQKGRIAIGGAADLWYSAGKLTALALIAMNTFKPNLYLNYAAPLGLFSLSTGFWSPAHVGEANGQPVNYPAQYVRCVAATVRDTVRVQRSRTIGVGE
jgi:hypothetical protein